MSDTITTASSGRRAEGFEDQRGGDPHRRQFAGRHPGHRRFSGPAGRPQRAGSHDLHDHPGHHFRRPVHFPGAHRFRRSVERGRRGRRAAGVLPAFLRRPHRLAQKGRHRALRFRPRRAEARMAKGLPPRRRSHFHADRRSHRRHGQGQGQEHFRARPDRADVRSECAEAGKADRRTFRRQGRERREKRAGGVPRRLCLFASATCWRLSSSPKARAKAASRWS